MKRSALALAILLGLVGIMRAGPEQFSGKEMKQVAPAPCPEWYADTEWNVSAWGAYAFTSNDEVSSIQIDSGHPTYDVHITPLISADLYLENDHAWGGGLDLKYFFRRYFGVGIEGFVLAPKRRVYDLEETRQTRSVTLEDERRAVGAALGTFTLRYPFHCSRFSPYVWGGVGAIFGGGEEDILHISNVDATATTEHTDGSTEFLGQVGGGLEVRITPHIGWLGDFSWNFVAKDKSDFGMVRTGVNFAF